MGDTALDLAFHAIEAGAVVTAALWHVISLRVDIAELKTKVDLLVTHTGLGQHREGD